MTNKALSTSGKTALKRLMSVYENSHKIKTYERMSPSLGCGCEMLRFLLVVSIWGFSFVGMKFLNDDNQGGRGIGMLSLLAFIVSSVFLLKNEPTKEGFVLFKSYFQKYLVLPYLKMKKGSYQKNMGKTNELLKSNYDELKNWFSSYSDKDLLEDMVVELGYFETTNTSLEKTKALRNALNGKVKLKEEKETYEAPVTMRELERVGEKEVKEIQFFTAS